MSFGQVVVKKKLCFNKDLSFPTSCCICTKINTAVMRLFSGLKWRQRTLHHPVTTKVCGRGPLKMTAFHTDNRHITWYAPALWLRSFYSLASHLILRRGENKPSFSGILCRQKSGLSNGYLPSKWNLKLPLWENLWQCEKFYCHAEAAD